MGLNGYPVFNSLYPKKVLEHQVLVLKGQINVDLVLNSFCLQKKGVGARKVGVERRKYKDYHFSKQDLVFKNQKLVFNNEQKTAS